MALTSLGGGMFMPKPENFANSNVNLLLDASGEKLAAVFRVPKTGTLGKVRFRTATVTTGDTMKVSFQDVDMATGNPDETADQYRTVSVGNADDNTWISTGLITDDGTDTGGKRSVTRGDLLAIVIEFDSYVAGNMNIVNTFSVLDYGNSAYTALKTGGTWVKSGNTVGCFELEYDDGSMAYADTLMPGVGGAGTVASNTTPDEVALYFQFPVGVTVGGAYVFMDLDAAADIVLYDTDGTTALATVSLDSDVRAGTASTGTMIVFPSEIDLTANAYYRLAIKPTTTTAVSYRIADTRAAASLDMFDLGQNAYWSQRTDAGAWSETTTRRPRMSLLVTKVHDGSGGSTSGIVIGG
jgi:uncharacterized protein YaaQ